jgi:hypothetical protein
MNGVITIAGVLFFPLPESLRSSYRGMKPIENKIWSIGQRIGKISDYIQLLRDNKDLNDASEIKKQKETMTYFIKYYDDYGALYLNVKLQFYIGLVR